MSQLPLYRSFCNSTLSEKDIQCLEMLRKRCSGHAILASTLANSGHPGGSLSTIPLLLSIYAGSDVDPKNPWKKERDRIIMSHGHVSPGTYSILGELEFFPLEDMILEFRESGSRYAGHVELDVPGVEWSTGNLGQGLSAGTASALACRLSGINNRTFVLMGDGEQQKGQISEARRFAVKYGLNNLIAIVDYNRLQISGNIEQVMYQNIAQGYIADGWNVIEVDGKDFGSLYGAVANAYHNKVSNPAAPTMILARTIMGYGISFIENNHEYHGKPLSKDQAKKALEELSLPENLDEWIAKKEKHVVRTDFAHIKHTYPGIEIPAPRLYQDKDKLDNRTAFGNALVDLAKANNQTKPKVLASTCDLAVSVKMDSFAKAFPQSFLECGIQEHHASTMAGRLSIEDFVVFFSTFGVFGVAETYNQMRLNTYNRCNLKLVCTHIGLNVGEDGPTHQSIDYIGLFTSLFHLRISLPADPNQTDRIIRKVASLPGNDFVGMGRARSPIITNEKGEAFFGLDYEYIPGKADWVRKGKQGTFIAVGPMVWVALQAHEQLKKEGIDIGVLNMASIAPIDSQAIEEAGNIGPIITLEDHHVQTGLGSLVANALIGNRQCIPFEKIGVTHYHTSGIPEKLYAKQGLTSENLVFKMKGLLKQ